MCNREVNQNNRRNMKIKGLIIAIILSGCGIKSQSESPLKSDAELKRERELNQKPLKIYIRGDKFGFGAIIYTEDYGQNTDSLFLDEDNIGITSYPYSTLIRKGQGEYKYQYFRIINKDTIPLSFESLYDSTRIGAYPTGFKSSDMNNSFRFIEFYAGKYPDRPIGVHDDSTEIGKWQNKIQAELLKLDKLGVKPQK